MHKIGSQWLDSRLDPVDRIFPSYTLSKITCILWAAQYIRCDYVAILFLGTTSFDLAIECQLLAIVHFLWYGLTINDKL